MDSNVLFWIFQLQPIIHCSLELFVTVNFPPPAPPRPAPPRPFTRTSRKLIDVICFLPHYWGPLISLGVVVYLRQLSCYLQKYNDESEAGEAVFCLGAERCQPDEWESDS